MKFIRHTLLSLFALSLAAAGASLTLPGYPSAGSFTRVVLFSFDDWAFPFRNHVETRLFTGENPRLVLRPGPAGSHDEDVLYYGTVIRVAGVFHLWYNGNYGPEHPMTGSERDNCCLCYATSRDGVHWEKPDLELVEFNGSKHNNIVDLPVPDLWSTCALLHDPEDSNPERRFKMAYEAGKPGAYRFCVAFSRDGLHWKPSANNPVGPFLEMSGVTKIDGLYYVNGQTDFSAWHRRPARRLATFVSSDFEKWSPCGAVGLDRSPDVEGPSTDDQKHQLEEVHLGAALWNRGNVLLGFYGQWHGHPSGDRRLVMMDLGFAISHDGLHYHEPIPNFRMVPAREQPYSPVGVWPALMQGQGMENFGEQTLYWYSLWRGNNGSGVRLVTWPRDRLGALQPFDSAQAEAISCLIRAADGRTKVFVNVSGLGRDSALKVDLVDEGFHPVAGYSEADGSLLSTNGFDQPIIWKAGPNLPEGRDLRLDLRFEGSRPEGARLYAVYLSAE